MIFSYKHYHSSTKLIEISTVKINTYTIDFSNEATAVWFVSIINTIICK